MWCAVCLLFLSFPSRASGSQKARSPQNHSYPRLSPGQSVDGCVTVCVLFRDKLAFFLFFKQPLIILSAYPLEQSAFDSHYMASGCLYPRWQRETEPAAHPILARSASGLGGGGRRPRGFLACARRTNSTCTACLLPVWLAGGF